jgi:phosphoglucomutase
LRAALPGLPGKTIGNLSIESADDFNYVSPVDGAVSVQQGIRVNFVGGSRIVFRLSGTGTDGATLRVYLERFEPAQGQLHQETDVALSDLIAAADAIAGIGRITGRTQPDVIT